MLYDPKWQKPADVFSLESLIAWLEKQPATETYCYLDHGRCLLGQYFSAAGFENVQVFSGCELIHGNGIMRKVDRYPDDFGWIALVSSRTFGCALKRARAMLKS